MAEYESLLHRLEIAKDYGIKFLNITDKSNLIVMQDKGKFACKNQRLKRYKDAMILEIENFEALSLQMVYSDQNQLADSLAISTSILYPNKVILE